jgi:hypothetical protein
MGDPFVSLLGGLPKLKQAAHSFDPVKYTCSVTKGGDRADFLRLPDSVARLIVTIGCLDNGWAIDEEPLQRTLRGVLQAFSQTGDREPDLSFVPFVVVLERTPVGACYTILCQYSSGDALQRYHEIASAMFEELAAEHSIPESLVWVSTMDVDSSEFAHLMTRTAGRDEGPFPLYPR